MMTSDWVTYRTVVYEEDAESELQKYTNPQDRFQDQLQGIEWLLARSPKVGRPAKPRLPTKNLIYVAKGNKLSSTNDVYSESCKIRNNVLTAFSI